MQNPHFRSRPPTTRTPFRFASLILWCAAIGPGVLGLAADNDAGGLLSYLVTGAAGHLQWFIAGLAVMAPITYIVQELALRVAVATRKPYGQLLSGKFGHPAARVNGVILHGLNTVILVTEFAGMTGALALIGVPWHVGLALSWALVLGITSLRHYAHVERLLLSVAILNLIFFPVLFMVWPTHVTWHLLLTPPSGPHIRLLFLSLAGNAIAPWMIYWQQNAVWAGNVQNLARGRQDIRLGVLAQVVMALVVLLIGGMVFGGHTAAWHNPLAAMAERTGLWTARLFALGIFNAGFLAACTISLSSAWMVREVWHPEAEERRHTPTQGHLGPIHVLTVTISALAVWGPGLSIGAVALWAQALGALWMPASLALLALIARDRAVMGPMVMRRRRQFIILLILAMFLILPLWSLSGMRL